MSAPSRAVVRYHGGKWTLSAWLLGFFPPHRVYVEPFGGGGSVLLQKERSYAEVYNDLDDQIVNVFRVLRDPATAAQLREAVAMTPFARSEYRAARIVGGDAVEQARRSLVRSFMGFASASMNPEYKTGFRSNSNRSGTTPARDWLHWPEYVPEFVERLRGVVVEHKRAELLIPQHDTPATLFYVDPPYPFSTRSLPRGAKSPFCYRHEMTDADHRALAVVLRGVAGMVIVSGYPCDLYDRELFADWERHERAHHADGARKRTEVVWLNPACAAARESATSQQEMGLGGAA